MARSLWTGSISFGLVNVPIRLYSAIESHRVAFHEFDRTTKQRIHYRRVVDGSAEDVPWERIEKGFEVRKGHYVVLTDEELKAAAPRKTDTIDIEQFVPLGDIDPVNWDAMYYVGPDGAAASKPYGLLRDAMHERGRVAIGRFVMRTKEYVACIRPFDRVLALHTMFYPDEVRSPKELDAVPGKVTVGKQELALAGQLIDALSGPFKPEAFKDTFRARVLELVRKKDKGQEITAEEAPAAPGKVLDLMAALKATLAEQKKPGSAAKAGARSKAEQKRARPEKPRRPRRRAA
ncbi:MAG TPA: Ku protein [Polyangia bacterium]|nr:Ku protein [Polyangia bacterium]